MSCCQQYGLYAAEEGVPRGAPVLAADLQAYVDGIRENAYWQRNFPNVLRIEATAKKTDGKGSVGGFDAEGQCGLIEMAPCHLCELFVLHEVSHCLAKARYGSHAHDPWFARTYLEMVSANAPHLYSSLYDAFVRDGIDFEHESYVPAGIQL